MLGQVLVAILGIVRVQEVSFRANRWLQDYIMYVLKYIYYSTRDGSTSLRATQGPKDLIMSHHASTFNSWRGN